MNALKNSAVAAAVIGLTMTGWAHAADIIPKEPEMIEPMPPMELRGGVYVRGYVGMTNQDLDRLDFWQLHDADHHFEWLDKGGFDSGMLAGVGIGYAFNDWFRMDVTGEYRGKTDFSALDRYQDSDGSWFTNDYSAKKSEWLFLLNAYLDLGTWKGLTPYVGAGIGASRNRITNFRDVNVRNDSVWLAGSASKWNLAWALHGGVGYEVTDQLTLDLAYRYVDLGDARTGMSYAFDGSGSDTPVTFKSLTSHDIMLGLRWNFGHKDDFAYKY